MIRAAFVFTVLSFAACGPVSPEVVPVATGETAFPAEPAVAQPIDFDAGPQPDGLGTAVVYDASAGEVGDLGYAVVVEQ